MINIEITLWDRAKDYAIISKWWEAYGEQPVDNVLLPDHGYIAASDGKKLAAGFVYFTNNAPIAYADWYVFNPDSTPREQYFSINALYRHIDEEAKKQECKVITTICANKPLIKTMVKNHSYEIAEHNTAHLIKKLNENNTNMSLDSFRDQNSIEKHGDDEKWKEKNLGKLSPEQQERIKKLEKSRI